MYQDYWELREPPFRQAGAAHYLPTAVHDEALARLQYLVDSRHRLGLLLGPSGSGKSLTLEVFATQLRTAGCQVAHVNLLGREPQEALWHTAAGWGLNPDRAAPSFELWRLLGDRLIENRWQHLPTVALFDDADDASHEVLSQVLRLVHCEPSADTPLTVVLAAATDRLSYLGRRLLDLAELRIDLLPWDLIDTEQYVCRSLERAGRTAPAFGNDALVRLHELSQGVARRIGLLAELGLLAAAAGGLPLVDAHTVESVYDELGVMDSGCLTS
ncbi:MAG TPA: AAA family ATPase [Pirellulales bacterium]|nr:AAA family ATPase [Pirellulales bacterium]